MGLLSRITGKPAGEATSDAGSSSSSSSSSSSRDGTSERGGLRGMTPQHSRCTRTVENMLVKYDSAC